jgi:hypothetical protein
MDRGSNKPSLYRSDDPPREELPETFVDRYTEWAKLCTDAPEQYHRVHGMMVLSTVVSPYRAYQTSYGKVKPNLWSMILAGTTMTRKTTSMKLALGLLRDCMPDFLLGTDGTPEGIFAELSQREGKVSVFHRDEISGWIESVTKREYMSGMLEAYCKFYDGQEEKRVLRSASYEVKDTNFIVLSGGIQSKMEELINLEHIRMGFIPRFIIVIGNTTLDQMTPIGPPKEDHTGRDAREPIVEELYRLVNYLKPPKPSSSSINLANVVAIPAAGTSTKPVAKVIPLTSEAWQRVQRLERDAYLLADTYQNKELYDAMFQRLVTTIIKCSLLLATARRSDEVELVDVLKAISYADEWIEGMVQFCSAIELRPSLTVWERKVDDVLTFLKRQQPEPASRTDIMRKFRLSKKQMDEIESTLEDRQYIKISVVQGPNRGRPKKVYELASVRIPWEVNHV